MTSPIELLSSLVVGNVEAVAPNEISVLLELDAPHAVALNTGLPTAFPRLNGYVLIPSEAGATIGYIAWLGIERSPFPKRSGLKDFGLIDLPFPLRKMKVVPIGTLNTTAKRGGTLAFEMTRGVVAFPSVGDQVLLPTQEQLRAIATGGVEDQRVRIGTAPMSGGAPIRVDPDKLFGRHLAVLGNTGSGKSCSVAGLIRWSLEAAREAQQEADAEPNARFIILDPNGEYAKAFADMTDRVRVFAPGDADNPFLLPAWMWNSHEWAAITSAQPGTQRPILMQALRVLRAGRTLREPIEIKAVRQLRIFKGRLAAFLADNTGASYSTYPGCLNAGKTLTNFVEVAQILLGQLSDAPRTALEVLAAKTQEVAASRAYPNKKTGETGYNDFTIAQFEPLVPMVDAVIAAMPAVAEEDSSSEDAPIEFDVKLLAKTIEDLSADGGGGHNIANLLAYLTLRLRSHLHSSRLRGVVAPETSPTLEEWLTAHIGSSKAENGQVAIVDLSLVPVETLHIIIAVLGRLVFEAMQRYCKRHPARKPLPTVMVLEEAHTFVRRGSEAEDDLVSPARLCREAFERIAREGRKFGLGLLLSSQRPSELSATVLAQCNTFLLHRIVNDADQALVAKLVPDNVSGLLRELPSLPSRQAILLGWATSIPVMVEMRELNETQRPQSDDPDFWSVWTGNTRREIDWGKIAADWAGEPGDVDNEGPGQ